MPRYNTGIILYAFGYWNTSIYVFDTHTVVSLCTGACGLVQKVDSGLWTGPWTRLRTGLDFMLSNYLLALHSKILASYTDSKTRSPWFEYTRGPTPPCLDM